MSTPTTVPTESPAPGMTASDVLAHEAASFVRVTPEVQRAVARYTVASAAIAKVSQVMGMRDLTDIEAGDFEYMQDVMRESWSVLAAAGQLHLIEAAS